MSNVARDLQKMFARQENSSIITNLQENKDFNEISKKSYLQKLEKEKAKFLDDYEKTQTAFYKVGEYLVENDVLDGMKKVADVASFLVPGKLDDIFLDSVFLPANILVNSYYKISEKYEHSYDRFFNIMADSIEKIQSVGESVRDEVFYYHIGIEDKKQNLSIFQLNSKTMAEFEKDKEIFKIDVKKEKDSYKITFKTQNNLSGEDIINGIERAMKKTDDHSNNLMYKLSDIEQQNWHTLRDSTIYSQKNGDKTNTVIKGGGRRLEMFDQNLLSTSKQFGNLMETINKEGYYLDNLTWSAGGDISGKTVQGENFGIQNKMFSYNTWIDKKGKEREGYSGYGFNISSYNTIVDTLNFYQDTRESIKKDSSGWHIDERSDFWQAIDSYRQNDTSQSEGTIDEELEEQAEEEVYNLFGAEE